MQDKSEYELVKVDMKDKSLYDQVHHVRRTFIEDLGDNQASLIEDDEITDIYLLCFKNEPVATARIHKKESGYKIERIATERTKQKQGLGKILMEKIHGIVFPILKKGELVYLHSQIHAIPFYEKCGYHKVGEQFIEDEVIWHNKMIYNDTRH